MTELTRGKEGRPGDTGRVGDTGRTGDAGRTGEEGVTGAPGAAGETGHPGRIGPTGATGDRGEQGAKGATGATGVKGPPGRPGRTLLAKEVLRSFVAIGLVSFAVLAFMGWQLAQNRKLIRSSRHLIEKVAIDSNRITFNRGLIDKINTNSKKINTNRDLINALAAVQQAQTNDRLALVERFAQSDLQICQTTEAIKSEIREQVLVNPSQLRRTLKQLNVDPDSPTGRSLTKQAYGNQNRALTRFAALKGGCKSLPSVKATK